MRCCHELSTLHFTTSNSSGIGNPLLPLRARLRNTKGRARNRGATVFATLIVGKTRQWAQRRIISKVLRNRLMGSYGPGWIVVNPSVTTKTIPGVTELDCFRTIRLIAEEAIKGKLTPPRRSGDHSSLATLIARTRDNLSGSKCDYP